MKMIILIKSFVEKNLLSMTENYDSFITIIKQSKDIETLLLTELIRSLEPYEARKNRRYKSTVQRTFQSKLKIKLKS